MFDQDERARRAKAISWAALISTSLLFIVALGPVLLPAGTGGMDGVARAFQEGGIWMTLVFLWVLLGFPLLAVLGIRAIRWDAMPPAIRGRAIPSAVLLALPAVAAVLGLAGVISAGAGLEATLEQAAVEQRANFAARSLAQAIQVGASSLVAAATLLLGCAYVFALRAWARVAGSKRVWVMIASLVLGTVGIGGAVAARALIPGWAGEVSLSGGADVYAFLGLIALALVAGVVTARAPAEERGPAVRDLALTLLAVALAVALGARLGEIRSVIELFGALDTLAPEERLSGIALGVVASRTEMGASLLALVAVALGAVPALVGLRGAVGAGAGGRTARAVAGVVALAIPLISLFLIRTETTNLLVTYGRTFHTSSYLDLDAGAVALPSLPPESGPGAFWDGKVLVLDREGLSLEGRRLSEASKLDSAPGIEETRAAVTEALGWPAEERAEGGPPPAAEERGGQPRHRVTFSGQDRRINLAVARDVRMERVLALLEAIRVAPVDAALLFEVARQEELPAPFDELPPEVGAVRVSYVRIPPVPDSAVVGEVIALDSGVRLAVTAREPREISDLDALERELRELAGDLTAITVIPRPDATIGETLPLLRSVARGFRYEGPDRIGLAPLQ